MKRTLAVLAVVTVFALGGVGASSAGAATKADPITTQKVRIAAFTFFPNVFKVSPGATVTVWNYDWNAIGEPHTLTATDGSFDSGVVLGSPKKFTAPTGPGRYRFYCVIHPPMNGFLIVTNS